ncbi:MAG: ACP S-malonyltransferase [Rhodospirillaceae bacterium]|nr:ACP S-malonyltransferase [Rhodospirillaceae bacterium]MBT3926701.1 ACP S-malonyltransferase [Rhodospirillaceae bacterium]MBT5038722.1 ACP S-malonyltransferase [Rhodospirillaceae bacterium]MBT5675847.1 ACP S-malonyltransferase [Rhodospirillaceae bacterium]MBT5778683.1 ACP S-malonyltransferase [Rhodospirillaceae bacterium]
MRRAFIFPGQGSQKVGMGQDLQRAFGAAREVFEEVDEALGEKLSTIIFEGPEEALRLTRNTQPALMAMSMAVVRVIERESGKKIADLAQALAGHSLGEYSALAAAGALSLSDAARLLRLRGDAMQQAVPVGEGAMAALLGADIPLAEEIAGAAAGGEVCGLANDNAVGQVVLSGAKPAIDRAVALAGEKGVKKAVLLPVSAPFHCAMMAPAAEIMANALAATELNPPMVPVFANVSAAPVREPDEIRDLLERQVTAMVRWRESVLAMGAAGVGQLVEVGAGNVLKTLTRRIDRELEALAVGTVEEIDQFLRAL